MALSTNIHAAKACIWHEDLLIILQAKAQNRNTTNVCGRQSAP